MGQRSKEKQLMIKKWHFFTTLTAIIVFLSLFKLDDKLWLFTKNTDTGKYLLPSKEKKDYKVSYRIPFTINHLVGFKEAIARKESQGKYRKVNTLGYMGKYQFGTQALRSIGVKNDEAFLKNPELQEKAFIALLSKNKWLLRKEIEKYEGKLIGGIYITESGILAAAHLGGASSVKEFFRNKGKKYFRDAYGTSIRNYMRTFGGYNVSSIEADNDATVYSI